MVTRDVLKVFQIALAYSLLRSRFLGRHATLPQKERLLTSEPHSFPVISQLQLGFHFQEPSRAKSLFETRSIRARFISLCHHHVQN